MIRDAQALLDQLRGTHAAIRDAVVDACERQAMEQLAAPEADEPSGGDTVFALDRISERTLLRHFDEIARVWPCILVAEGVGGLSEGAVVLPHATRAPDSELTIIVDPIDGTRGLMYQKRPAWILTGVANTRRDGRPATLADIELAVQTEIPLVKQHLCDSLWVVDGVLGGERFDRLTGKRAALTPHPSQANTIAQGYGGVARFFPGGRDILAAIDDAVVERLAGTPQRGRALTFEDQYISTGGQLYELMMGHDRWIADLRPLLDVQLRAHGRDLGLCCHPYDLCTESIARAAGVIVIDERGERLTAPLDVTTDCAWIGFANDALCSRILPVLRDEIGRRLR